MFKINLLEWNPRSKKKQFVYFAEAIHLTEKRFSISDSKLQKGLKLGENNYFY